MKKTAIMQPYFFPYIGYWQLINAVDVFLVYDDVNYIKNGWINRNNILVNGAKFMFTLPLVGASPFSLINQICCTKREKDKDTLRKTLEQSYKKAPYYTEVAPIVFDTLYSQSDLISEKNWISITRIAKYLGMTTQFALSSALDKDCSLKGQDKVISVCKLLKTEADSSSKRPLGAWHQTASKYTLSGVA